MNKATQDQIAAVMMLYGTPAQQAEVVAHISQQQVSDKPAHGENNEQSDQ
jgi:hypothetical protein